MSDFTPAMPTSSFQRSLLPQVLKLLYLPPLDGLSSENSACHNDSQACFFAGVLTGEAFTGDWGSKCRCSDLIDFDGDFDLCRVLLGDMARESDLASESCRIYKATVRNVFTVP